MTHERESDQLRQRRANLDELAALGVPTYPRAFTRTDTVAELVEAHGGRIWVDDGAGSGSDFRFVLPIVETKGAALTHV